MFFCLRIRDTGSFVLVQSMEQEAKFHPASAQTQEGNPFIKITRKVCKILISWGYCFANWS